MSKHFQKVLKALKTSDDVKALGFDKEEIKRLASDIDKKLNLEDDASDEDVDNAIEEAVDAAVPYLKMAQSTASRIIKKKLAKPKKDDDDDDDDDDDVDEPGDDDDDDDDDDDNGKKSKSKKSKKSNKHQSKSNDSETNKLLSAILKRMDKQDENIANLRKGNTEDKRRAKLEKLLKDTGSFGKRYLRQFDKMTFEDDEDFDDFLEEVQEDLDETNQERANAGLEKLGIKTAPPSKNDDHEETVEEITDEQLDKLADQL